VAALAGETMRGVFGRVALAVALVALGAAVGGCDDGPTDPAVGFLDGHGPHDTGGGAADAVDVAAPAEVRGEDLAGPDRVEEDAGPPCFVSPYVELPIAAGALSSYSRAEMYPSIRQWSDRARALGYRGMIFQDKERRGRNASAFDQFSDTTFNPDNEHSARQHVFIFDKNLDFFENEGAGAVAIPIVGTDDPEISVDPGIRLKGVADGWARVTLDELSFSYDLQDLWLQVRVKAPRTTAGARILVRYTYAVRQNKKTLTWVLFGEAREGESLASFAMAPTMKTAHLPLKQQILEQPGPPPGSQFWADGALTGLELRVEGDAEAIFDDVRLRVDAFWEDYRAETTKYSLASGQLVLIPGVEYYFVDDPEDPQQYGQVDCVSPDEFPASSANPGTTLFNEFAGYDCFTIADRPWAGGAAMKEEYVRKAAAIEIWHPLYESRLEGAIALEQWDAILLAVGPRTGIGSSFARDTKDLSTRTIHNRVLATAATEDAVLAALQAGRSYLTDDIAVSAELWAERPACARAELGEQVADALALHARVSCPAGVQSAKLVRFTLPDGVLTQYPLEGAGDGVVVPVDGWPDCYVRLEAECVPEGDEVAPRVYTNPIWLTDELP